MRTDKKYRIVFIDDEDGWSNCDQCGKYGNFDAGNFAEEGLFGFIGFELNDFIELGLTHLNENSIRCETCLTKKEG